MTNNFYITESQFDKIKTKNRENNISKNIMNMIDDNNSPIKSNTPIIKNGVRKLILNGYEESISDFKDDITNFNENDVINKLNKLITIAKKKEQPILMQLEGLCEEIISKIIDCDIECKLVTEIPPTQLFHITTNSESCDKIYDSIEHYNDFDSEIRKRKILNTLSMGCALNLFNIYFDKYLKEIFNLDEDLPHLYSKIMKINNYLTYISSQKISEKEHFQSGYVNVILGNEPKIEVTATLFPFLLIESFRGVLESISSKQFLNNKDVFSEADTLEHEPYYMTVGNVLWKKIYSIDDIKYILPFFKELSELKSNDLISLFDEIIANTRLGNDEIQNLFNSVVNKCDYSDFEQDLLKKNNKHKLILGSEYNCDELLEDTLSETNYPQNFNIEHFKSLPTFNQRVNYCNSTLERLGSGSSRIVYLIDNNTVLKLAKNKKGVAQNEREIEIGTSGYYQGFDLFADVYEYDENGLWLEMQYARRAKKSDFKRILGESFEYLQEFIQWTANHYLHVTQQRSINSVYEKHFNSDEFWEIFDNDYTILNALYEMMLNEQLKAYGDLMRISSWGVVNDTDGEKLVLIDFGLNDDVFNNYYKRLV